MSEKPGFRTSFDSQHAKRAQVLLKYWQQHLYHVFLSLCQKRSWKVSLLEISEVLGLFANILTADDEYSLCNSKNLRQPIKMQLAKKQKILNFLLQLWNLHQILNILKKWWQSYVMYFQNYGLQTTLLDNVSKAPFQNTVRQTTC